MRNTAACPIQDALHTRGRLRGVIISGVGNSGTFTCTVPISMQVDCITEQVLFSSCMSVIPSTEDSGTPVFLTAFLKEAMFLIQRRLVLIASPVLCSPTIKGSTVVAVRVVVRLGSVVHRRSWHFGSATMAGWSAPLLLTSRVIRFVCHFRVRVVVVEPRPS